MKLNKLIKITEFVNKFKSEYDYLQFSDKMNYEFHAFKSAEYSIVIFTGTRTLDSEYLKKIFNYLNSLDVTWWISFTSYELYIHVQ